MELFTIYIRTEPLYGLGIYIYIYIYTHYICTCSLGGKDVRFRTDAAYDARELSAPAGFEVHRLPG